ncbi:MAG: thermonuclease family protein [Nitrospira sp.]|nr:thermonuclease family protein [Nitrospira sp.]
MKSAGVETAHIILFLLLLSLCLYAGELSWHVISVLDGDTIEVLHNRHSERIRLSGIDCPEKGQAFGQKAKHTASDLAFGKEVTIQTHGHDKYKRTIGDVILPGA